MGIKDNKMKKGVNRPVNKKVQKPAIKDSIDTWCASHKWLVIALILLVSVAVRIVYFVQIRNTPLIEQHKWDASDMYVFNQWADSINHGDMLSQRYVQPENDWMQEIAGIYFKDHPDKFEYYKSIAGPDTVKNPPSKLLWIDWYGKSAFPHEPLYAYFVAFNYKVFGKSVYWVFLWQLLLGVLTNLLVFLVTRRHFGEFAGVVAAFLAIFFGPLMFFELTLLRSTFAVFFTILLVYVIDTAFKKDTLPWWILSGAVCGLATLVHAYYFIFLVIWFGFLLSHFRNNWKSFGIAVSGCLIGFIVVLTPLMIRNVHLGLPAMKISNNSAVGFITMNNDKFKSFNGWMVDSKYVSDIMYTSNGSLLKSIIPTLKTHPDLSSYLGQVYDKLHATFSWFEIQNNVNFYFYRQLAPVLYFTFISFLIVSPLALVGLGLAISRRKKAWPLYFMILVLLVPMLAFMVLARYRIVFAVVLIPFAAYTIAELFTPWKNWKNILLLAGIAIIALWTSGPRDEKTQRITKLEYVVTYYSHYADKLQAGINEKNWGEVDRLFADYLRLFEPEAIKTMNPSYRCKDRNEAAISSFFAKVHMWRSNVLYAAADTLRANQEAGISAKLKEAANQ
jgi:ABC-type multidrug transport system fused ATPase/permease subunit